MITQLCRIWKISSKSKCRWDPGTILLQKFSTKFLLIFFSFSSYFSYIDLAIVHWEKISALAHQEIPPILDPAERGAIIEQGLHRSRRRLSKRSSRNRSIWPGFSAVSWVRKLASLKSPSGVGFRINAQRLVRMPRYLRSLRQSALEILQSQFRGLQLLRISLCLIPNLHRLA